MGRGAGNDQKTGLGRREEKAPLITLVGVSGAGKDTLIRQMDGRKPVRKPISATTRAPREGEIDGRDYHFLSQEAFQQAIDDGKMFEWTEFNGNRYGTLLSELSGDGDPAICIRENEGAKEMRERLGALQVGVVPPSWDAIAQRLRDRGDDEEDIQRRLEIDMKRALELRWTADTVIVNDDLETAARELAAIVEDVEGAELSADDLLRARREALELVNRVRNRYQLPQLADFPVAPRRAYRVADSLMTALQEIAPVGCRLETFSDRIELYGRCDNQEQYEQLEQTALSIGEALSADLRPNPWGRPSSGATPGGWTFNIPLPYVLRRFDKLLNNGAYPDLLTRAA